MHQEGNRFAVATCDEGALNELFAQHYNASLWTALKILRSKEDSEDAVQTAYCAAFRKFHQFRGESSFKTWITRIVVNCCLIQLRDRHSRPQLPLEDYERAIASQAPTPELLCYWKELQTAHATAASSLSTTLHDVYAKSALCGIGLPETAAQLGLTSVAAKSRLHRARRKVDDALRPLLHPRAAPDEPALRRSTRTRRPNSRWVATEIAR
jgi:RNA polymerase sigma-70 factor (ECF subfamily)